MRLLLKSKNLGEETGALLVGAKGDIAPVTLVTRDIGAYVEVLIVTGQDAKEKPKTVVMGRGPVVAIPTIVKTMLRERVNAYGAQAVAERIGCSRSAISSVANGQGECHAALLEAILGYLGNTGECMDLFATNENPAAHGNAQTGHNQTTKGILS
jgi:transcriptional regulator with XRE-family HTH domain